ncbi:MAG: nickel pincer cofactor biosynthesis protein LarC [Lyngbya sp.]|nr:nickel pincer cofactor biosynthesis protein LarC [Lyngbya sp.]
MTKIAYFQCPTGIAGDMCLGALVHAGVPLEYIGEKLERLGLSSEYRLWAEPTHRNGQLATKVHVDLTHSPPGHTHHHHHGDHSTVVRHLPDIENLILSAQLPKQAEAWSLAIFRQLAEAEGAVHGISPQKVHFHEVGATDAIVDIVGTCLGLNWLEIEQLYCSALPTGGGVIRAAHGQLPVPAPATLKLLESRQVPVYSNNIERELVTPTGAAIAVTLAQNFGQPPAMSIQKVGLGAGSRDLPLPNILRLWIGETSQTHISHHVSSTSKHSTPEPSTVETISVLETQIDDLSPQAIAFTLEELFSVGALDVFTQPITMKKSRLGVLLTVICHPEKQTVCEDILFKNTTTLGIRSTQQKRRILPRQMQIVDTPYGSVSVKVAYSGKTVTNVQPEYEDCAKLARHHHISWLDVHRTALENWYNSKI